MSAFHQARFLREKYVVLEPRYEVGPVEGDDDQASFALTDVLPKALAARALRPLETVYRVTVERESKSA